jgi:hypothetical protein
MYRILMCAAAGTLFISSQAFAQTANQISPPGATARDHQQLMYSVLFADQQGITHFRDENLVWQIENVGTLLLRTTPYLNAEKIGFLHLPQGFSADWHPAPGKRFVMVLTGIAQVEAGDGERRTFAPGSVLLVTDTQGPGHRTIVLGEQDVFITWVPIP